MIQLDHKAAQAQLQQMNCSIDKRFVAPVVWSFTKILRELTQGLFVEQSGIKQVKQLIGMNERVVLIPHYKSFADFFILQHTLAHFNIEPPFCVGNMEDTPHIHFVNALLKGSGYILARRSRDQSL